MIKKVLSYRVISTLLLCSGISSAIAKDDVPKKAELELAASNLGLQMGYSIHGIDVSHYQSDINWDKLHLQELNKDVRLSFVFIRATMGANRRDAKYDQNWQEAKRVGLIRAPYHYFDVKQNVVQQVENFMQNVNLEAGDLPPVLDLETRRFRKKKDVLRFQYSVKFWLKSVELRTGVKPIVYCSYTFYNTYLANIVKEYPLWIAYYYKPLSELKTPNPWKFWQHSDKGTLDGVHGFVDMNVFNGTRQELQSLCVGNSCKKTSKVAASKMMSYDPPLADLILKSTPRSSRAHKAIASNGKRKRGGGRKRRV